MFAANCRILIVDDMKTMRTLLKKSLNDLGFKNLEEAEDGDKAWACIQDGLKAGKPFDLVISDWNMPKLRGIDLLRKVRADKATRNMPFLMVTAEVEASSMKEANAPDARVSGFLSKPFRADEIKAQLEAASGKKAA